MELQMDRKASTKVRMHVVGTATEQSTYAGTSVAVSQSKEVRVKVLGQKPATRRAVSNADHSDWDQTS